MLTASFVTVLFFPAFEEIGDFLTISYPCIRNFGNGVACWFQVILINLLPHTSFSQLVIFYLYLLFPFIF
jgi:hypothetical protein